ncbi:hypothetical protein FALBO_10299 [Fusarium albosuccineum]|uniref:Uncharacterized protein n=1 Tax=Fusarium albosuccineum TaxID=1237068 RepID=A0A8H4L601_9HYPO|nr:hypothetical protein FALBO_10299 [Fusarium albosuccineum]
MRLAEGLVRPRGPGVQTPPAHPKPKPLVCSVSVHARRGAAQKQRIPEMGGQGKARQGKARPRQGQARQGQLGHRLSTAQPDTAIWIIIKAKQTDDRRQTNRRTDEQTNRRTDEQRTVLQARPWQERKRLTKETKGREKQIVPAQQRPAAPLFRLATAGRLASSFWVGLAGSEDRAELSVLVGSTLCTSPLAPAGQRPKSSAAAVGSRNFTASACVPCLARLARLREKLWACRLETADGQPVVSACPDPYGVVARWDTERVGIGEERTGQSGTNYGAATGDTYRTKKCGPGAGHSRGDSGPWRPRLEISVPECRDGASRGRKPSFAQHGIVRAREHLG